MRYSRIPQNIPLNTLYSLEIPRVSVTYGQKMQKTPKLLDSHGRASKLALSMTGSKELANSVKQSADMLIYLSDCQGL